MLRPELGSNLASGDLSCLTADTSSTYVCSLDWCRTARLRTRVAVFAVLQPSPTFPSLCGSTRHRHQVLSGALAPLSLLLHLFFERLYQLLSHFFKKHLSVSLPHSAASQTTRWLDRIARTGPLDRCLSSSNWAVFTTHLHVWQRVPWVCSGSATSPSNDFSISSPHFSVPACPPPWTIFILSLTVPSATVQCVKTLSLVLPHGNVSANISVKNFLSSSEHLFQRCSTPVLRLAAFALAAFPVLVLMSLFSVHLSFSSFCDMPFLDSSPWDVSSSDARITFQAIYLHVPG